MLSQPVRSRQGIRKDEVVGCQWVVVWDSGEAVGEGNGTFLGLVGKSQTRVPGLALSCPYHCTSASSEHRGLLRKQLSPKDLQANTETRVRWTSEDCFAEMNHSICCHLYSCQFNFC